MDFRCNGFRVWAAVSALLCLIACAPRRAAAKETWIQVISPHFRVISNAGDKDARKTADQFEQFREVLHSSFPSLRLDLGRPLIIFAVKNEDSLKALLPGYWEVPGRAHPAGVYVSGEERHFVALRTNIEAHNRYEVVYHEYAHAILNLNFRDLPVWLSEGLAEYFGNSIIRDNQVDIGIPSEYLVRTLQQSHLIPIAELLSADRQSPYYNEQNRVSVFYAESWAMVHYLLLDPDARKRNLLATFLKDWEASGDQVDAARRTFGDLKKFSDTMEAYARNPNFMMATVKTSVRGDPESFTSHEMSPAELNANRALFYLHTRRPTEAGVQVREALQQDPQLSLAHEAQGLEAYMRDQFAAAGAAFSEALELSGATFSAFYFAALCKLRAGVASESENEQLIDYLKKTIIMNPLFAPAYANLASIYSLKRETADAALQVGRQSVELDPTNLQYAINYANVLLNTGKLADAKALAVRIRQAAWSPKDKLNAEQLLRTITDFDEQSRRAAERAKLAEQQAAGTPTAGTMPGVPSPSTQPSAESKNTSATARAKNQRRLYMIEGVIADAECNESSAGRITLTVNHSAMRFVYSRLAKLTVVDGLTQDSGKAPACADWKGQRVRLYFYQTKDKPYAGELQTVQFF
jgi:tetratricopeptide (TPR) repeat protein